MLNSSYVKMHYFHSGHCPGPFYLLKHTVLLAVVPTLKMAPEPLAPLPIGQLLHPF